VFTKDNPDIMLTVDLDISSNLLLAIWLGTRDIMSFPLRRLT
jgi:hypothetical protein